MSNDPTYPKFFPDHYFAALDWLCRRDQALDVKRDRYGPKDIADGLKQLYSELYRNRSWTLAWVNKFTEELKEGL